MLTLNKTRRYVISQDFKNNKKNSECYIKYTM